MRYVCTICSRRKRRDPGRLPAIRRYLSRRIGFVERASRRLGRPFAILSGEFGFLGREDEVPWYDHRLSPGDVDALVPLVARQLAARRVTEVLFYARPRSSPGWRPYHEVMEKACRRRGIPLTVARLDPRHP
jgi:hypothetical protein